MLALLDAQTADLDELGKAAAWVFRRGAKRAGLDFLNAYFLRGGRDHGRELLEARLWWGGRDALPDLLEVAELAERGAVPCLVANTPDDLRCGSSLRSLAESAPDDAEAVRVRAADKFWRTAHGDEAGAWVIITLRAWLAGTVDSWLGELTRRVDVDSLADRVDGVPAFARPTILRALGELTLARNALPAATADASSGSAAARAVVVAEIVALGIDAKAADELLHQEPSDSAAWIAAARGARVEGDVAREAALLDAAPSSVRDGYLWRAAELGPLLWKWPNDDASTDMVRRHATLRWWQALESDELIGGRVATMARWNRLAPTPDGWTLGDIGLAPWPAADPIAIAAGSLDIDAGTYAKLIDLAAAYADDPAVADRLADDFVDGEVYVGVRAPVVAELFAALGDPVRALAWRERVVETSGEHPDALHALGAAAAEVGDTNRAEVHFIAAAAGSGDAGAASERAVRALVAAGAPIDALLPGRRAVQLTAPGEARGALEAVVDALVTAGREEAARALLVDLVAAVEPAFRDAARAHIDAHWHVDIGEGTRWIGRRDHALMSAVSDADMEAHWMDVAVAVRYAADQTDSVRARDALERAISWNPANVEGRAVLLSLLGENDARRAELISELTLVAQVADAATASRARALVMAAIAQ
jgi:hypothetical protein